MVFFNFSWRGVPDVEYQDTPSQELLRSCRAEIFEKSDSKQCIFLHSRVKIRLSSSLFNLLALPDENNKSCLLHNNVVRSGLLIGCDEEMQIVRNLQGRLCDL